MQQGDFPSLAKRPYEDAAANTKPAPSPPLVTVLPAPLLASVDKAMQKSSSAHSKFLRNLPGAKRRGVSAARGAAVSSEAWVMAQMDMAALEMDRSPSVDALADIDALYLAQLDAEFQGTSAGGAAIIEEKRDQIQVQVKLQQGEIDAMKGRLR